VTATGKMPLLPRLHVESPAFSGSPGDLCDEPGHLTLKEGSLAGSVPLHGVSIAPVSRGALDKGAKVTVAGGVGAGSPQPSEARP